MREEINTLIYLVKNIARTSNQSFTKEFNIARTNSYTHLSEARFWLGFELQKIKESDGA